MTKHRLFIPTGRFCIAALLLSGLLLCGCGGRQDTALSDAEAAALTDICGMDRQSFGDVTEQVMTKALQAKFRAVAKVYEAGRFYAFILKPVAYNGPLTLAAVIDGDHNEVVGIRIVQHTETPHYVRDMESDWFVRRFAGKAATAYLEAVRLSARNERDIVAITGATVTTEAIVNGVNAAIGVYQEHVLGEAAGDVPYMVRFEPGEGDGPAETKRLTFRAYGLIVAEVSLEDIRTLPSVKRTMQIHSSQGVTRHEFRGTRLSNIMEYADPKLLEDYSWILAVGVDDYMSGIGMEEVKAENKVYVMYEDNGEPLTKLDGEPGSMRIVVLDDVFGQRFTNYLLEIVLESKEPF
ncbi:MAG: FMN-binding protein [Clostridiales bacterium]|nr:FMN-binding protein [Clostridiales bacterium]